MAIPKLLEHQRNLKNIKDGTDSSVQTISNTASGDSSFAEGYRTTASNLSAHAEGFGTTASGPYSHAEGYGSSASGVTSHAEGSSSKAIGNTSHAEGRQSEASGESSHAEGRSTLANGNYSHAEGDGTTANSQSQHVQGEYNILDTGSATEKGTYAHIVGNGTPTVPSNAHTIDWSGNAWFAGDVYTGSTSGTNKDEGSKKLATEEYVDNSGGTFYATYQTTTYTEIVEAYNQGKSIILYDNNKFYPLINMDDTTIVFGQRSQWNYGLSPQIVYKVASDDTWSTTTWSDIYGNWSMGGNLSKSGGSVNLTSTTRYYRPILVSTSAPTSSDGQIGDIWIVYKT